ncbi:KCTD1_15 [Mytilus coruscus]|uniref:KCTD1_15 n=1 Tax=Mytilus coruscus TaxID=42192 RepID=A0A6J8AUA1_MYTCO|nr:KCTD1_15 [Mytilus coruscus]
MEIDILEATKDEIANLLQDFYANIRNKSHELYKKNTLLAIRQSINRYLKENDRLFDIINEPEFTRANDNFTSLLRKTREEGKGTVTHHEAISLEDLKMLYEPPLVFNTSTPQGLINKTISKTILYFCRRGQKNLSQLKVDEFKVDSDQKGQMYVRKLTTELTNKPPRNEPIGQNTIKVFMKNLSKSAKLSREYTNHCIRSTCITLLDYCGFQSRHIKTISGHKNEASLSSYCYDTSDKQKKSMSDALSKCTYGTLQQTESRSVTISLSQEKTVSTFTSDENEQPIPVIESVSVVGNSKRRVETAPYDPDIIDFLGLPDNVLMDYSKSVENSENSISAPKQMKMMPLHPSLNISNCTVNINYYN